VSDVVVVGLGADGSAAAMHLARHGERVLGLEAFPRGHTLGSSGGRTRVIRLAYYEHPDYVPLLRRAWELSRELETATGEELLRQTGGLYAGPPDGPLRETTAADAAPVERFLADHLPTGLGALRSTNVCRYTVTPDEHFVIDADDRVVYASACSGHGFKFASVVGEILADLATTGRTAHEIGFLSRRRFA